MRTTATLAVAALAAAAAPASGAATRVSVVAPPSPLHDGFSVTAGLADRGAAVVGWTDGTSAPRAVVATRSARTGRFSAPRRIGAGRMAYVAISPDGRRAAAMWVTRSGRVRVADRTRSGRWAAQALPLLPGDATQSVLGLVVSGTGGATALIEQRASQQWRLFVLRRSGAAWRTAASLAVPDDGGGTAAVARDGSVVAAWIASGGDEGPRVVASRLPRAAGDWEPTQTLVRPDPGLTPVQPFADVAADGGGLVLTAQQSASGQARDARVYWGRPGGPWRMLPLEAQAAVGLSPAGRVWVANASTSLVQARTVDDDGRWAAAEPVGRVRPGRVSAGPGIQSAWNTVAAWWVVAGSAGRPDRWIVSTRGARGWSPARQVAATRGVVAFAGGPGGLGAAFVDGARGGRVSFADLPAPGR